MADLSTVDPKSVTSNSPTPSSDGKDEKAITDAQNIPKKDEKAEIDNPEKPKEDETKSFVPTRDEGDGGNEPPAAVDTTRNQLVPFNIMGTGSEREIPDINFYQHKKTLGKGMMDLALFSANANQLRYVLECADRHPYYYPAMVLIIFSLLCQVAVGFALLWNAMYNIRLDMNKANRANNCTVIGIFLVTVVNVFISAFGVANPPTPITIGGRINGST